MKQNSSTEKSKNRGFTLVELIVVIAILAILAAVAYPVYTGYIKKAQEAADLALLGAVNEAFASACIDEGISGLPAMASAQLKADQTVDTVTVAGADGINTSFFRYFEGNKDKAFAVYDVLGYDRNAGGFYGGILENINGKFGIMSHDNGDGTKSFTVKDSDGNLHYYTVRDSDVLNYNGSSFEEMGIPDLMKQVDNVTQAASKLGSSLGGKVDQELLDKYHINRETYPDEDSYNRALANAMVLQVAEATANAKPGQLQNIVDGMRNGHMLTMSAGGADDLSLDASLAVAYAMITGYANSEVGKTQEFNFDGKTMTAAQYYEQETAKFDSLSDTQAFQAVANMMNTMMNAKDASGKNGFDAYYDANGAADLAGYTSALNAINDNRDTLVNQDGVIGKGFVNEDLAEILGAILAG